MKKFITLIAVLLLLASPAIADNQIMNVPVIDQDIFEVTFNRNYICGPTVWTELMGYWGENGYPNLLRGPLSGDVPDTSSGMQALFQQGLSYSGYTGTATYAAPMADGVRRYFADNGYEVDVIHRARNYSNWTEIKAELDAGRPVLMLVWSWSHWVILTGYTDDPRSVTMLYGHIPYEREYVSASLPFASVTETVIVRPQGSVEPPADPSTEYWYQDVTDWCQENGWELEPRD